MSETPVFTITGSQLTKQTDLLNETPEFSTPHKQECQPIIDLQNGFPVPQVIPDNFGGHCVNLEDRFEYSFEESKFSPAEDRNPEQIDLNQLSQ